MRLSGVGSSVPPCEKEIRRALRSELLARHRHRPDTVILQELGICRGRVRVDLALVNGLFHGYEIKSDRDNLRRLPGQVELYSKVLDRATLVVGDHNLTDAVSMLPRWWGVERVIRREEGVLLDTIRKSRVNPERDPRALVELLWREHALALLEQRKLDRGVRSKPRRVVWDRVCAHFHVDEIAAEVRTHLRARVALPCHPSPS